jgi:hypothetical protein
MTWYFVKHKDNFTFIYITNNGCVLEEPGKGKVVENGYVYFDSPDL